MTADAPRRIDALLDQYAESHRHPVNERIHVVCIPLIVISLLGLLWSVHPAAAFGSIAAAMIFYVRLSLRFACGMAIMSAAMTAALYVVPDRWLLPISAATFVVAWIGQFVGHRIEGRKPSFLEDLRFLLIGPLFVLGFLYRRLGLRY